MQDSCTGKPCWPVCALDCFCCKLLRLCSIPCAEHSDLLINTASVMAEAPKLLRVFCISSCKPSSVTPDNREGAAAAPGKEESRGSIDA